MKLDAVAALGVRLSQLSDRREAGLAASHQMVDAFEADAVVVWLPSEVGPCRAGDVSAAGPLVPPAVFEDLVGAVRAGALKRWLGAHGAAVSTIASIGVAGGPLGLLALAWRQLPLNAGLIEAFLAQVAEQLRAVLAGRGVPAAAVPGPSGDPEQLSLVQDLRDELARLKQELADHQRATPAPGAADGRQRTILESTSDYVFVKDIWGRHVEVNGAYASALGLSATDVVGKRDADLFPAEVAADLTARDHVAQVSGQTLEDEVSLVLASRPRHLLVRRSPWRNAEGQTVGVVTVATDVTDRKEAEMQRHAALDDLRRANERMQGLLDDQMRLSRRGSALLELTRRLAEESDIDGVSRAVVDAAERQLNGGCAFIATCDPAGPVFSLRLAGTRAARLRHLQALGDAVEARFGADVLEGGGATSALLDARYRFDAALVNDGMRAVTSVPVSVAWRPQPILVVAWPDLRPCPPEDLWFLENVGVQLGLALKRARLYSDLRQSLLSLQQAQQEVLRAQRLRALGDLASGIAHKFNNLLTTIVGLADWLLYTLPADARGRAEIETIRTAADETAELVKGLRAFGRVTAGGDVGELVDPVATLRQLPDLVRRRLEELARRRQVRYDLVMDVTAVPLVRFAASELRELLLHLVTNAVEAMPAGGKIVLRSAADAGAVRLSVVDEGEGIAPGVRKRLFEPFFTTRGHDNLGLGLSVCRSIAERHGAKVELVPNPDGGATASVLIPVPAAAPSAVAEPPLGSGPPERPSADADRLRVLLVDDQHDVLEAVAEMVAALGHTVELASSGEQALAVLRRERVAVMLTDLGMPGMDGRELARRARAICPGTRVVLLTGWTGETEEGLPPGVAQVLAKPITMSALRTALTAAPSGVAAA
jgi:PAS domain S-box-containing protein